MSRWECLEDLTNRPWFSRTWVIQEIALASKATLFCGEFRLDWSIFLSALQWLVHTRSSVSFQSDINLSMHIAVVQGDPNKSDEVLMSLLNFCREFDANDPRDKVYGLLGHPALRGFLLTRDQIEPDHSKSVADVFKDVAMIGLLQDRSLAVLSYIRRKQWSSPENDCLPSFVPRWDGDDSQYRCLSEDQTAFGTATCIEPDFQVSPCGNILEVRGCVFDVVTRYTDILEFNEESMWFDFYRDLDSDEASGKLMKRVWETLRHSPNSEYPSGCSEHEALGFAVTASCNDNASTSSSILADYSSFILETLVEAGRVTSDSMGQNGEYDNIVAAAEGGDLVQFGVKATPACMERRLFRTSKGYFGLGSPFLESGDLICILFGTRTPFILRKKDDAFGLIEDCYISGIMSGEAIEMWQNGELSDMKFRLQ